MFSLMLMLFLFAVAVIAVLAYVVLTQERQFRRVREDVAELRVLLRALESRLRDTGRCLDSPEERTSAQPQGSCSIRSRADTSDQPDPVAPSTAGTGELSFSDNGPDTTPDNRDGSSNI